MTILRPVAFAALALAGIGPDAGPAVPALIEGLKDARPFQRRKCAAALGQIGPSAAAAVPRLKELLEDKDPEVKKQAAEALRLIKK